MSAHYFDDYFKTNNSVLKLANLRLLKQARDLRLISEDQYKEKQLEFLRGIDFALEKDIIDGGVENELIMDSELSRTSKYPCALALF